MKRIKIKSFVLLIISIFFITGCTQENDSADNEAPVSNSKNQIGSTSTQSQSANINGSESSEEDLYIQNENKPFSFSEMRFNNAFDLFDDEEIIIKTLGKPNSEEYYELSDEDIDLYQMGNEGKTLYYDGLVMHFVNEEDTYRLVNYRINNDHYLMGRGIKIGISIDEILNTLPMKQSNVNVSTDDLSYNDTMLYDYPSSIDEFKDSSIYNRTATLGLEGYRDKSQRKILYITDSLTQMRLYFKDGILTEIERLELLK